MNCHARAGMDFARFACSKTNLAYKARMEEIINRIFKRPYRPQDMDMLKRLHDESAASAPIHIHHETHCEGADKKRVFRSLDFGFTTLGRGNNLHGFMSTSYYMARKELDVRVRPFPLLIQGPELGLDKMRGSVIPLTYDERFVFVLASSLLIRMALDSGMAHPESGERILLPTTDGLYSGHLVSGEPFKDLGINYRQHHKRTGSGAFSNIVPMEKHDGLPEFVVYFDKMVASHNFVPDLRWIDDQFRMVLRPAKESGLLMEICRHYARELPPEPELAARILSLVESFAFIMNSPHWRDCTLYARRQNWAARHTGLAAPYAMQPARLCAA